jgi:hypothetical protein
MTARPRAAFWRRINPVKILIFIVSLLLFTLALELMKAGARGIAPLLQNLLTIDGPLSSLGFGWLSAYLVLSGSPVAAAALTFFDIGLLNDISAFAMISGSRLGASMIVLLLGVVYALRGHEPIASMVTGVLSLIVTAAIYIPALAVGLLLLDSGSMGRVVRFRPDGAVLSVFDRLLGPVISLATRTLPDWAIFLVGLAIIVGSFNLFDRALPDLDLQDSAFRGIPRQLYRPIVTFGLGLALTLLTLSVSVSLGLLVPLSARGYIRRENLVPYIMGCNITTFIDTLVAGLLLGNPAATAIVVAQMLSVFIVSIVIIALFFVPFERTVLRLVVYVTSSRARLAAFLVVILLVPLALLVLG